jgi:hypothetical protein
LANRYVIGDARVITALFFGSYVLIVAFQTLAGHAAFTTISARTSMVLPEG